MADEQPAIRDGSADAKFQGELATYIFVSVGHLRQKLNHLPLAAFVSLEKRLLIRRHIGAAGWIGISQLRVR